MCHSFIGVRCCILKATTNEGKNEIAATERWLLLLRNYRCKIMFLSKTCVFPPGVTKLICDCKNANEHNFFKGQRARRSNVQVDSQSVICRHHSVFTNLLFTNSTMKL